MRSAKLKNLDDNRRKAERMGAPMSDTKIDRGIAIRAALVFAKISTLESQAILSESWKDKRRAAIIKATNRTATGVTETFEVLAAVEALFDNAEVNK